MTRLLCKNSLSEARLRIFNVKRIDSSYAGSVAILERAQLLGYSVGQL